MRWEGRVAFYTRENGEQPVRVLRKTFTCRIEAGDWVENMIADAGLFGVGDVVRV